MSQVQNKDDFGTDPAIFIYFSNEVELTAIMNAGEHYTILCWSTCMCANFQQSRVLYTTGVLSFN